MNRLYKYECDCCKTVFKRKIDIIEHMIERHIKEV